MGEEARAWVVSDADEGAERVAAARVGVYETWQSAVVRVFAVMLLRWQAAPPPRRFLSRLFKILNIMHVTRRNMPTCTAQVPVGAGVSGGRGGVPAPGAGSLTRVSPEEAVFRVRVPRDHHAPAGGPSD